MTLLFDPAPAMHLMRRQAADSGVGLHTYAKAILGDNIDRQICRWNTGVRMTVDSADRVANTLGVHPIELWGDDWLLLDDEARCA